MIRWLFLLLLLSCSGGRVRESGRVRDPRLPASGAAVPAVLYPRHRILSPAPVIMVAVPAFPGPVEIVLRTDRGLCFRKRTRRRAIPWPPGKRLLAPGERGFVLLHSRAGKACGGFLYDPPRKVSRPYAGRGAEGRRLLLEGYPMEALRLLVATGPRRPLEVLPAVLRAGFPTSLLW